RKGLAGGLADALPNGQVHASCKPKARTAPGGVGAPTRRGGRGWGPGRGGDMEKATVQLYERQAALYAEKKPARHWAQADAFAPRCLRGLSVLDAGCGPGGYLRSLPRPAVALDAAVAMLALTRAAAP